MTRRVVWFALLLLIACGGMSHAATSTALSGPFPIDNTAGDTRVVPPAAKYFNPYFTNSEYLIKGQLHCHRCQDKLPKQPFQFCTTGSGLAQLYRDAEYGFVAVTEHDEVSGESTTDNWCGWAPHSCEVTHSAILPAPANMDAHILAVGTNASGFDDLKAGTHWYDPQVARLSTVMQNIKNHAGLAFIAHPDSKPYAISVDDLNTIFWNSAFDGIAVFNSNAAGKKNFENTWDKWIDRNRWSVRSNRCGGFWGIGEDDYHYAGWNCGNDTRNRAWVAVPGSSDEWWGDIKEKLRSGDFYAYWVENGPWTGSETPASLRVTTTGTPYPTVTAAVTRNGTPCVATIRFRTKDGWYDGTDQGTGIRSYVCNGNEGYVRVKAFVVQGYNELSIASQPIVIYGSGDAGLAFAAKAGVRATSPELELRYAEMDDLPSAMPVYGCLGHIYEVTTATGQLPPDATLQLSYDGEDTSAIGGTQYLAIYGYDEETSEWTKVGGTVDPATATIESPITVLGKYCISADLPEDTTAPEVFIDNPPCGGVVSTDTTVRATVNDDLGAWRVSFYMNDHLLAEDADAMDFWTANIPSADYCTGNWTLKAVAEDLAGNEGSVEIPIYVASSTPAPTVSIASPTPSSVLSGAVTANGTCGDDVAVASVALKMNSTVVGYGTVDASNWTCDIDTTYLADGARTLSATVEDYPGNQASASVQVTVNNGAANSSIGSLKQLDEGDPARFAGGIVTAGTDLVTGGFYVEAENRSSGILVLTGQTVNKGDIVSVVGTATAVGPENAVQGYDVFVSSSGNDLPKPIGMQGYRLLWPAPDSIGKYVKVWGKVVSVDTSSPARWFVLDDGSGVTVKCTVPIGVTAPTSGLVAVTGVCSVDATSGGPAVVVSSQPEIQTSP